METIVIVIGLLLLFGPVMAIIAFVKARRAQERIGALEKRLDALALGRAPDVGPSPSAAQVDAELPPETEEADDAPAPADGSDDHVEDEEAPTRADADLSDPPEPASRAPGKDRDLETAIGTRWAVWTGGLALALGGLFLVKYSIDQGLLSPAVRIALGLAFSVALLAAGEWARRRPGLFSVPGYEKANIPAILTAAGSFGAFGSVYAGFSLYGFFSPLATFAALGVIAVLTTLAALLHGPLLAAVGLIGSYATPFLIGSRDPQIAGLALYVLAVSGAALAVARIRLWRWLANIAGVGLIAYGGLILVNSGTGEHIVYAGYLLAAWAMVFYVAVASFDRYASGNLPSVDWPTSAILILLPVLLSGLIWLDPAPFVLASAFILMVCLAFAGTHGWPAARPVVVGTTIALALGYLGWALPFDDLSAANWGVDLQAQPGAFPLPFELQQSVSLYLSVGGGLALAGGLLGLRGALWATARAMLATGGVLMPLLVLAAAYLRVEQLAPSVTFGFAGLALSGIFTAISVRIDNRLTDDSTGREHAVAAYVIGALAALALAAAMTLDRGGLTIALGMMVPVTAFVHRRKPLGVLKPVAVVFALLWVARVAYDPRIVGDDLGTTPVFNWLLFGYGIPAAGFVFAAWHFGRAGRDRWTEVMEAIATAAVTGAVAIVGLHAIDPASVFSPIDSLAEAAFVTLVGAGIALGLLKLRRTASSQTLSFAVTALGLFGMIAALFGLLGAYNPVVTGEPVGPGLFFNALWFAYLAPGFVFIALAWASLGKRPDVYTNAALSTGGILLAAFVTLTIRLGFHPDDMDRAGFTDLELYTYSGVWLAIGIGLLAAGIVLRLRTLRLVSGAIIVAVVLKVFLIDMANLTGILRAFSFVSLGGVLIAIGFVYQRLMRKD